MASLSQVRGHILTCPLHEQAVCSVLGQGVARIVDKRNWGHVRANERQRTTSECAENGRRGVVWLKCSRQDIWMPCQFDLPILCVYLPQNLSENLFRRTLYAFD